MTEQTEKKCPFCKEMIKAEAIKCRFCGEFLEDPPQTTARTVPPGPGPEAERQPVVQHDPEIDRDMIFEGPLSKLALFVPGMKLCLWILGAAAIGAAMIYRTSYLPAKWIEQFDPKIRMGGWGLCAAVLIIGGLIFYYHYLVYRSRRFVITNDRIEFYTGLFTRSADNLEMWRINDIKFQQPFIQRILGVGTVIVESTDASDPELIIGPVGNAKKLYEDLRRASVEADRRRGVVRLDS